MRILLLNWRDPWHPKSGGAEILTLRILERLAARGWQVEWFSASYRNARADEIRNGIRFVRAGSQVSVHVRAFERYRGCRDFDVVIEQINTIPFFSKSYGMPSIVWFQQLAREVWLYEAPPIVGALGYLAEPFYLRPLQDQAVLTISRSTAASLREIGFRGRIEIISMASDETVEVVVPEKVARHDILTISRLTPSKRVEESIRAADLMRKRGWLGMLHIIGAGSARYTANLMQLADRLGLEDCVRFHGRVSAERRSTLISQSTVLWMTSAREGWGLVVTEAAAKGTPAVVYDVAGLRDAVRHGVTGLVVAPTPQSLAEATERLMADSNSFAQRALADAATRSWDQTTAQFASHVLSMKGSID